MTATADAVVVDASVAVKWHLNDEEHAQEAARLLTRFSQGELVLVAPDHIRYEVPSAITVATRGSQPHLTVQQGQEAIAEFLALGLTTIGTDDLILAAYPLVHQYVIALYDALYLALALRLQCSFVTADRKLYQRIKQLPAAVWITDHRTGA
jgi:predicted nucleic acid-binding protein